MRSQRERMFSGEPYRADGPELVAGADPAVRVLQGWCVGLVDTLLGM